MQDLKCHVKSKILSNHNMPRTSKLLVQLNLQSNNGQRVTCSHSGQNHLKSDSNMDWQWAWLNVLLLETFIKWAMSGEAQVNFSKAFTVTSITSSWFENKHWQKIFLTLKRNTLDLHIFCHAWLHSDWPRRWSVVHVWVRDFFLKFF